MNLREKILAAKDVRLEKVHIESWQLDVYLKKLNGRERETWEKETKAHDGEKGSNLDFICRFISLILCDENGKQLFNFDDSKALGDKDYDVLMDIFNRGVKLNAVSQEDIDELQKN